MAKVVGTDGLGWPAFGLPGTAEVSVGTGPKAAGGEEEDHGEPPGRCCFTRLRRRTEVSCPVVLPAPRAAAERLVHARRSCPPAARIWLSGELLFQRPRRGAFEERSRQAGTP